MSTTPKPPLPYRCYKKWTKRTPTPEDLAEREQYFAEAAARISARTPPGTPQERSITAHQQVSPLNALITIDQPHDGSYSVYLPKGRPVPPLQLEWTQLTFKFQEGSLSESGVNGLTVEVLTAIVIARLEVWQHGPYRCDEYAAAIRSLQKSLLYLTDHAERIARDGDKIF